jgi:cytochrome c-type biogenesis protein CcmH/NrfF
MIIVLSPHVERLFDCQFLVAAQQPYCELWLLLWLLPLLLLLLLLLQAGVRAQQHPGTSACSERTAIFDPF